MSVIYSHMLPDYLASHLDIVFVGLNPGEYSDRVGHYFARKQNLFWSALYRSGLVPVPLTPQEDARIVEFGYGLTDIVKRVTPNIDGVTADEFREGGQRVRAQLEALTPRIICFVGLSGYRHAFDKKAKPGAQGARWGKSHLFVVPSTSPRNAGYSRQEVVEWFKRLKAYRDQLKGDIP